ncbi:MAG TPA: DUF4190 domain-containing protein [Fimbriimonadaceae bacterium]|nr:DUF4190 domain-containing protein [Fimbriimonadaceae bacterium]
MSGIEGSRCETCGAFNAPGTVFCSCGRPLQAGVQAPPTAAYPRPGNPPQFISDPNAPPTFTEKMIPVRNPMALAAYYCAVFSLVPCFSPILGPTAVILGILGLKQCNLNPVLPGKGHAITGIVLGGFMTLISVIVIVMFVAASLNRP